MSPLYSQQPATTDNLALQFKERPATALLIDGIRQPQAAVTCDHIN